MVAGQLTEAQLAEAERDARLEVRQAARDLAAARERATLASTRVGRARETLALSERSYVESGGSSLEVSDARRDVRRAEEELLTRQLETQLRLVDLLAATGNDLRQLGGA